MKYLEIFKQYYGQQPQSIEYYVGSLAFGDQSLMPLIIDKYVYFGKYVTVDNQDSSPLYLEFVLSNPSGFFQKTTIDIPADSSIVLREVYFTNINNGGGSNQYNISVVGKRAIF